MKDLHDIIKRPVLSEKSYDLLSIRCYTFIVDIHASKTEIKQAVEEVFDVKVEKVRTLRKKGKLKRQGRHEGYTPKPRRLLSRLPKIRTKYRSLRTWRSKRRRQIWA